MRLVLAKIYNNIEQCVQCLLLSSPNVSSPFVHVARANHEGRRNNDLPADGDGWMVNWSARHRKVIEALPSWGFGGLVGR